MKHWFVTIILCLALFIGGCTSTFLVSKDCKTYFFGEINEGLYKMLCPSGDLKKVLDDTGLPQEIRDDLYKYSCIDRSKEKVKAAYSSLTCEQKRELKFSFQRHGFDINYKPVGNYRFGYGYRDPELCTPDSGGW